MVSDRRTWRGIIILSTVVLWLGVVVGQKTFADAPTPPDLSLVFQGHLLNIIPEKQELALLYSFHPSAPTAAFSPDGHWWGKIDEKSMAAFDPQTGKIVAVVDLRLRFQLPEAPLRLNTPLIAMTMPNGRIGIVVDDVDDVEEITEVIAYDGEETPYVKGVVKQADRLLLLLDVEKIYDETRIHSLQPTIGEEYSEETTLDADVPEEDE